jgi:hypothetical protein
MSFTLRSMFAPTFATALFLGFAACGDDEPAANPTGGVAGTGGGGGGGEVDTTPPSLTVSPEGDLGLHEAIVVTFDEAVDPESLVLGGSLAGLSDGGVWSANDTLTITPSSSWESGLGDLSVAVDDVAGNTGSADRDYTIRLVFSTFQEAAVVIGQPDFASGTPNQGGPVSAQTIRHPWGGTAYDPESDIFFVPDYGSNRVLGFAGITADHNAAAIFALGQPGLDTSSLGTSATELNTPGHLTLFDGKLSLTEYSNNRIAIYDPIPAKGPGTIEVVVGQADKESAAELCAGGGLLRPDGHTVSPDGKLIVADTGNNRVMIWNTLPTTDGASADLVLGQQTFTTCASNDDDQNGSTDAGPTDRTLQSPAGAWSDGIKLVVVDAFNHRILIWNAFPTTSFQPADVVLGQSDFTHGEANDADQDGAEDAEPTAATLNGPYAGIWSNGVQLIVTDSDNQRVLVWNAFPASSFEPADVVLGQGDFTHAAYNDDDQDGANDATPSARTLTYPNGLSVVHDKLIVSDHGNSRFLVFESQ